MAAAVLGLAIASPGWTEAATVTTVTLLPGAATNVNGDTTTFAPGFDSGSWAANGGASKQELYIPVTTLFGSQTVTIGDIASVSYWTNKPGDQGSPDWTFLIYTAPQTGDPSYHTRLNSEPYFSNNLSAPSNSWNEWSSDGSTNQMRFYDQPRSGTYGTYTDPTLDQITSGPVTWNGAGQSGTTVDYTNEVITTFSLQTGSAWANGFSGLVDGLTITLKNGDVAYVNLEAVPEPATIVGTGFAALFGLGSWYRRHRRTRATA
jgi:hypothetical protein